MIYDEIKVAFSDQADPNYQHSALTVLSAFMMSKGAAGDILRVRIFDETMWFIVKRADDSEEGDADA